MMGGVGIYGVLVVIFAASSSFALSLAVMASIGLCHVTSHALVPTVISSLFACRISRREDGDISHDSGRADCRRNARRRAVNLIGAIGRLL